MDLLEKTELLSLSPSGASDFKTCPQLFKFRAIDRLEEPVDPAAALGTLVHEALERLLQLGADERSEYKAHEVLDEIWKESGLDDASRVSAHLLVHNYFRIEEPNKVETHELEWWVEHETSRALLRGIIDRVEVLPSGEWILSDYKTGRSPSETYAFDRFFGLRFYALVCWRAFGKMPKELRLIHLKEPEVITLLPTPQMLEGVERQIEAIGAAIERALERDDFRPRRGYVCNWCPHRSICPAWENAGGATPHTP
jgi:putative RecB family exonuclease